MSPESNRLIGMGVLQELRFCIWSHSLIQDPKRITAMIAVL